MGTVDVLDWQWVTAIHTMGGQSTTANQAHPPFPWPNTATPPSPKKESIDTHSHSSSRDTHNMHPFLINDPAWTSGPCYACDPTYSAHTHTHSPTAYMSGSLVRMCTSTLIPPLGPSSRPAALASPLSGRTPITSITRSAGSCLPLAVSTVIYPPGCPHRGHSQHVWADTQLAHVHRHTGDTACEVQGEVVTHAL